MTLLIRRRLRSAWNGFFALTGWELGRNLAFTSVGIGLLAAIYLGFFRLLSYLETVPLIGELLLWKLTAMMMLATFMMVVVSSLLTALSTLYYSYDLKFLMGSPIGIRKIFVDKSLESLFFASWMILLLLVPYMAALIQVKGYGWSFLGAFLWLAAPCLTLGGSVGLAFTLALLYLFPSSRTRDVIWVGSSLSLTAVYGLVRFSQPERLIRPDALMLIVEYLEYLQAPTAPYLPSWWMTAGLSSLAQGRPASFAAYGALLWCCAAVFYGALVWLSGRLYFQGFSGAQEGGSAKRTLAIRPLLEPALFWKERLTFFRDVKHWSQILMIAGLVFVYLFSIRRLPLDNADLRSLVSFLNIGAAGFVIAALGLRFTYPSISLEGRSWWVLRAAPLPVDLVMRQKLLFSAGPMTLIALLLGATTNYLLEADRFTAWLSLGSLLLITWGLCAMGIGFGALFPLFAVENVHQIESSLGGFIYMAASLFYVAANVIILSWPMNMHFQERFGNAAAWDFRLLCIAAACWIALHGLAFLLPWSLGRRKLEGLAA
ncbi:MAG: hypothetical protein HY549_05975 [Elusimicrobia bacterium]|nr:hypothetical protein [Elusimicrobiota bacterium]